LFPPDLGDEPARDAPAGGGERLLEVERRLLAVDSLPVSAQDMSRAQSPGHGPRRQEAEERVHAEPFAVGAEVGSRAEGIGADEYVSLGPPERHLPPPREAGHPPKRERRAFHTVEGNNVERDAESFGESGAVAPVPVEKLNDARGACGRPNPLLESLRGKRVDEPSRAARDEHMRRPLEETRLLPPEPLLELVTGPEIHLRGDSIETRI
jgi:hypothetical protein